MVTLDGTGLARLPRPRRAWPAAAPVDDPEGSEDDCVSVGQHRRTPPPLAVHPGAILASEVFDGRSALRDADTRMHARYLRRGESDAAFLSPSHERLALGQEEFAFLRHQGTRFGSVRRSGFHDDAGRERIAKTRDGSNEARRTARVSDGLANLGDHSSQARVADVRVRPKGVSKLVLMQRPRATFEQQREELQSLWGERHERAHRGAAPEPRHRERSLRTAGASARTIAAYPTGDQGQGEPRNQDFRNSPATLGLASSRSSGANSGAESDARLATRAAGGGVST